MSRPEAPETKQMVAYKEGWDAYMAGKRESANHHYYTSELYFCWKRGYATAKFGEMMNGQSNG